MKLLAIVVWALGISAVVFISTKFESSGVGLIFSLIGGGGIGYLAVSIWQL